MLTMTPEYIKAVVIEREMISAQADLRRRAQADAAAARARRIALPRPFATAARLTAAKA
jgi:hypothetical protein